MTMKLDLGRVFAPRSTSDRDVFLVFSVFSLIAMLSLLLRIESVDYLPESLWCEDGSLLINQSHRLGIASVWTSHAGYLHVYHRIFALAATLAPLAVTPFIFLAGWALAFLSIILVLIRRAEAPELDRATCLLLILSISLQPNDGATFLNLGQSFYFLNIAFALYICLPSAKPTTPIGVIFLGICALSGPGSEILAVILAIRLYILRDFITRKLEYLTVWICASIQFILTLLSYTVHPDVAHKSMWQGASLSDMPQAIASFLVFGSDSVVVRVLAVLYWSVTTLCLFPVMRSLRISNSDPLAGPVPRWVPPVLATLTACAFFGAGMIRQGRNMALLNPLDYESHYFVLPYSLFFFVSFWVTSGRAVARMLVLASLSFILGATFLTLDRPGRAGSTGLYEHENLQWIAFTKLQKIIPDTVIPINPQWPMWPQVWNVQISDRNEGSDERKGRPAASTLLDLSSMKPINAVMLGGSDGLRISSAILDATIDFSTEGHCPGMRYVAIEVDAWRSRAGWTRLYWGDGVDHLSQRKSLRRFYPAGSVRMQYAFRRDPSDKSLRLALTGGVAPWIMQDWKNWIFGEYRKEIYVPAVTPPGGDAIIRSIKITCVDR